MPVRIYECKKCNYQEEIFESISVKPEERNCCHCNKKTMRVVILTAPICQVKEVKTIGQLADSNWNKMGTYERENKMHEDKVQESIQKRDSNIRRNKVSKMTAEQKEKYIVTGEMP